MNEVPGKRWRASRLPQYDYRSEGAYFVTICAWQRHAVFDNLRMRRLVEDTWNEIPSHFAEVRTDAFVVMPNHVHGIVFIESAAVAVGPQHAGALRLRGSGVQPGSLAAIVRSFKAVVTKEARQHGLVSGDVWQRNYYERVVRNEAELNRIREYVILNPARWQFDHENQSRTVDAGYEREWGWLEAEPYKKRQSAAFDIRQ